MGISLTVIIPTLNEGESIGPTIDQIPRNLSWLDVKVLIIDGNSTDNTAEEAKKRGAIVHNEPRKGYGRAYKTGFSLVDTDYVATIDGVLYQNEIIKVDAVGFPDKDMRVTDNMGRIWYLDFCDVCTID